MENNQLTYGNITIQMPAGDWRPMRPHYFPAAQFTNLAQAREYFKSNAPYFTGHPSQFRAYQEAWNMLICRSCMNLSDQERISLLLEFGMSYNQHLRLSLSPLTTMKSAWDVMEDHVFGKFIFSYLHNVEAVKDGDIRALRKLYSKVLDASWQLPVEWYESPGHMFAVQSLLPVSETNIILSYFQQSGVDKMDLEDRPREFFRIIRLKYQYLVHMNQGSGFTIVPSEPKPEEHYLNRYKALPPCPLGCVGFTSHTIKQCPQFTDEPVVNRQKFVKARGLCFKCLLKHANSEDCNKDEICQGCPMYPPHHYMLHNDPEEGPPVGADPRIYLQQNLSLSLCPLQDVTMQVGQGEVKRVSTLFDSGSQITFIDNNFACLHKLPRVDRIEMTVIGANGRKTEKSTRYALFVNHINGDVLRIIAVGWNLDLSPYTHCRETISSVFPEIPEQISVTSSYSAALIIGQDNNWLQPVEIRRAGNLTLQRSMLIGDSTLILSGCIDFCKSSVKIPAEFWSDEDMGTDPPQDNFGQAVSCMKSQEKRLRNKVFIETVERGKKKSTPLQICMNSSMKPASK